MAATQPPAMSMGIHVPAIGSFPSPPTATSNPVTACMSASLPGSFALGPVGPNPLAWQYTAPGRSSATTSAPMPSRSATPTRKLCRTTSAQRSSPSTAGRASGAPMSRARLRLPRWQAATAYAAARIASPVGGSTLMTSAPRSASTWAPRGPATKAEKSTTRSPASGRVGRAVLTRSASASTAIGVPSTRSPPSSAGQADLGEVRIRQAPHRGR
jgi:hypothetical protein